MQGYADGVDGGYDDGVGGYCDGVSSDAAYAAAPARPASASGYAGLSRADPTASLGSAARASAESLSRPLIAGDGARSSVLRGKSAQAQAGSRSRASNTNTNTDTNTNTHADRALDEGCCCAVM